jgi:hypothetical protein
MRDERRVVREVVDDGAANGENRGTMRELTIEGKGWSTGGSDNRDDPFIDMLDRAVKWTGRRLARNAKWIPPWRPTTKQAR